MINDKKYELLADGESKMASVMGILPNDKGADLSPSQIEYSLRNNKDFSLKSFRLSDECESENITHSMAIELSYRDETYFADVLVVPTQQLNIKDFGFANNIDQESLKSAKVQTEYIEVSMNFGNDNLESFHLQLKVLHAIVPEASVVIDFMSFRLLSAKWLKMTAESKIPPSPDYLYTSHGVYDKIGDKTYYWLHTHGLQRCGSVELEMLNITQGVEEMNTLLNMTVKKFISDPALERERFTIGYDGMGINLCWLRWEEALKEMPSNILGSMNDRKGEDNIHANASGVIFAVEDGNMVSPEIYAKTLADNPIYYISNEETFRMSALAMERFGLFKSAFEKENPWKNNNKSLIKKLFKSDKPDESEWAFLVKLGIPIDGDDENKEHLWFEVSSIDDLDNMEVKLLNSPYWIPELKEGKKYNYPSSLLTDWVIYGPDSTYTTDTIYQLDLS